MDWDGSPLNYTCFHPESPYPEDTSLPPIRECVTLPKEYLVRGPNLKGEFHVSQRERERDIQKLPELTLHHDFMTLVPRAGNCHQASSHHVCMHAE